MSPRVAALRDEARKAGLAGVLAMPGPNMVYLTGLAFHLSERPILAIVPVDGPTALLIPQLEATKARASGADWPQFTYDDVAGPLNAAARAVAAAGLRGRSVGVEARRLRFLECDLLRSAGAEIDLVAADAVFASLRVRKSADEIDAIRRAAAVAEAALAATLPLVTPGVTEHRLAARLTTALLECGSEPGLPFTPIVASGPNGALPHAFPTHRAVEAGDLVTFDWGATVDGYASDITRTYAVERPPSPELREAYEAVERAAEAGRDAARPGALAQDVDRAARAVIDARGLGELFVHRTGHGLGLEGHEEPDIKEGSEVVLEPGMAFTVEPGVYIPDVGGVRIEDDVVITASGSDTLTTLPRELLVLG